LFIRQLEKIAGLTLAVGEQNLPREACLGRKQAHERQRRNRFSRARFPDQTQNFTGSNRDGEIVYGDESWSDGTPARFSQSTLGAASGRPRMDCLQWFSPPNCRTGHPILRRKFDG